MDYEAECDRLRRNKATKRHSYDVLRDAKEKLATQLAEAQAEIVKSHASLFREFRTDAPCLCSWCATRAARPEKDWEHVIDTAEDYAAFAKERGE